MLVVCVCVCVCVHECVKEIEREKESVSALGGSLVTSILCSH